MGNMKSVSINEFVGIYKIYDFAEELIKISDALAYRNADKSTSETLYFNSASGGMYKMVVCGYVANFDNYIGTVFSVDSERNVRYDSENIECLPGLVNAIRSFGVVFCSCIRGSVETGSIEVSYKSILRGMFTIGGRWSITHSVKDFEGLYKYVGKYAPYLLHEELEANMSFSDYDKKLLELCSAFPTGCEYTYSKGKWFKSSSSDSSGHWALNYRVSSEFVCCVELKKDGSVGIRYKLGTNDLCSVLYGYANCISAMLTFYNLESLIRSKSFSDTLTKSTESGRSNKSCDEIFKELYKGTGRQLKDVMKILSDNGYAKRDIMQAIVNVLGSEVWE